MNYVTLGKTGLKAAQVSFGGIPIQRSDAANTKAVVDKLEQYGMNYIDTARGYTVSEEYLGAALEGRRDKFILATKSMARDKASMAKDIDISLNNLRTDYIDVYQIHNLPENEIDKVFGEGGAWEALEEAKAAGKVGHLGVTAHNVDALKKMIELHGDKIETIMFPYNIVEIHGHEVLKKAKEMGIGTIAMKPMAGGNLDDWNLALRFIAASGVIDISIPGMGSPEEADRNAEAAEHFSPLTPEEMEQCDHIRKELGNEFCRRCNYCAPCPNGINIPGCFLMANYARKYGLADWAKARYDAMPYHAGSCVQCGACERRCPYNLPIRDMLGKVADLFGR
nr:aldo/keto reductase [uncultured Flavonifractor sp.]